MEQLTRFRIEALHGTRTIEVPIRDNRLVLVGENGTGKSTVANFIYFFLTRQWNRMMYYRFDAIRATLGGEELSVTKEDLRFELERQPDEAVLMRRYPSRVLRTLQEYLPLDHDEIEHLWTDQAALVEIARQAELPTSLLRNLLRDWQARPEQLTLSPVTVVQQAIKSAAIGQVLFLPTYRRIEQDLQSIFLGDEEEVKRLRARLRRRSSGAKYVEFVEFGMEDVEATIGAKMAQIKENVRNGLNKLTGTYLRDVIRGRYKSADFSSRLQQLDEPSLTAIFSRIPAEILSDDERTRLRAIVQKARELGHIQESDKVVAHFLSQLIELHEAQQEDEKEVRDFVRVCNSYLVRNKLVYDNLGFEIYIQTTDASSGDQHLSMKDLSSGEKQIVSLFSHIYLSGGTEYYVIIDEPELSLSVPWQKNLLPDILRTGRCSGLIAVTHSPFVFDNELDEYAHSLEEFVEPVNELR